MTRAEKFNAAFNRVSKAQDAAPDMFDNAEPNQAAPAPKAEHAPVSFAEYEACRSALVARTKELDAVKQARDGVLESLRKSDLARHEAERLLDAGAKRLDSLQAELNALRADVKGQGKQAPLSDETRNKIAAAAVRAAIDAAFVEAAKVSHVNGAASLVVAETPKASVQAPSASKAASLLARLKK